MTELTKPDLVTKGMELLPSFWDDKPKARGLLQSLLQAFQNPLDLIFEVLNGTSLTDAEGVQLDVIGKLWNVSRLGDSDSVYRDRIFLRITRQISDSTPEKILEIIKLASNATEISLFEHINGNVHVSVDTGVLDSLKQLGESLVAAGVSFNIRSGPIEDDVIGTGLSALEYVDNNIIPPGSWLDNAVTTTENTGVAPDNTNSLFEVEDSTTLNTGSRLKNIAIDVTKKYFVSCWVVKDTFATHNAMLSAMFTGTANPDIYEIEISLVDGTVFNGGNIPNNYNVLDFKDLFLLTMEVDVSDPGNDILTVELYPSISTTLGSHDNTVVGATTFWQPIVAIVDETKHYSTYESQGNLIFSEIIPEEYKLVDQSGDFIGTEDLEHIIVDVTGGFTPSGAHPLAEFGNTVLGQPCAEVL